MSCSCGFWAPLPPLALQAQGAGLMTLVSGSFYSPRGPQPPPCILPTTKPPFRWTTHEGPGSLPSLWT